MKSALASVAAATALCFSGATARAQVLTKVTDVADGYFDLSNSTVYANGGFMVLGGAKTFTDGIRFDTTPLANQTLLDFSVTTTSVFELPLGATGSLPFGYYVGGFTDQSSGANLASQQYVAAGNLNFEVVTVPFGSQTGIMFNGADLKSLAQAWINNPSANYGFVFSSKAPGLVALVPPGGGALNTRETGLPSPFGTALSVPVVPEPKTVELTLAAGAAAFAIREAARRKQKQTDLESGKQRA